MATEATELECCSGARSLLRTEMLSCGFLNLPKQLVPLREESRRLRRWAVEASEVPIRHRPEAFTVVLGGDDESTVPVVHVERVVVALEGSTVLTEQLQGQEVGVCGGNAYSFARHRQVATMGAWDAVSGDTLHTGTVGLDGVRQQVGVAREVRLVAPGVNNELDEVDIGSVTVVRHDGR